MKISKSVGRGGTNLDADVKIVQQLLNAQIGLLVPCRPLTVDGKSGPQTELAISLFQERVVRLVQPDGKIDPSGPTWRLLSSLPAGALLGLPPSPHYYSYEPPENQFGTYEALRSLEEAAREFYGAERLKLGIGDISLQRGGEMRGHTSHQKGLDIDIRPLRLDGKEARCDIRESTYSRVRTQKLVDILRRDPNLSMILFNDTQILGVQKANGHDNHLHVRYKS